MMLTDKNGIALGILENILSTETADGQNAIEYALGSIPGITEQVELRTLRDMQQDGLLNITSHRPSGAIGYTLQQEQDSLLSSRDSPLGPYASGGSMSLSVNRPAIAVLSFKRERIEEAVQSYKTHLLSRKGTSRAILVKDQSGNFRFMDKPILIGGKPLDRGTKSYKILDILYEKGDQEGRVAYTVMAKWLEKRGETLDVSEEKNRKMVNNAMQNTLFRRGKVGEGIFENKLPDGERLVKTYKQRGRFAGWQLHNPLLP